MVKILLINAAGNYTFPNLVTPPLGVMYLASVLRQRNSHQVKIIDMRLDCLEPVDVLNEVSKFKPDIVGISAMTSEANILHQLAKEIKKVSNCKIIAGGPHVTTCPEDGLNDPNIDYIVLGEGEQTLPELIEAISGGGNASRVKGIGFSKNGDFIKTLPREYIQNLDELPSPAWDLIKLKDYWKSWRPNPLQNHLPYMVLVTSRGCPYHCIYCDQIMGKQFRARSPENVFSEIETLYHTYDIRDFEIRDSCFNLDRERALKICDLIISSGLKIGLSFSNGLRGDLMDDELLLRLRKAGTYQISYAIETASPRLQKLIKKNVDLAKIEKIIIKTFKLGIITYGFFMLGFPTETREELEETARFALSSKLDMACFFIVNPFPNTELYQLAKKTGKNINIHFERFSYMYANFNLSEVGDKELLALQKKLYSAFYSNPKRIFRFMLRFPNKRVLLSHFILFLVKVFFIRSKKCHRWLYSLKPL